MGCGFGLEYVDIGLSKYENSHIAYEISVKMTGQVIKFK